MKIVDERHRPLGTGPHGSDFPATPLEPLPSPRAPNPNAVKSLMRVGYTYTTAPMAMVTSGATRKSLTLTAMTGALSPKNTVGHLVAVSACELVCRVGQQEPNPGPGWTVTCTQMQAPPRSGI